MDLGRSIENFLVFLENLEGGRRSRRRSHSVERRSKLLLFAGHCCLHVTSSSDTNLRLVKEDRKKDEYSTPDPEKAEKGH